MNKKTIPIFYACDEGFIKYSVVSIHSMMVNASTDYHYCIYILHAGISEETQKKATKLAEGSENFDVIFTDVSERLHAITDALPVRDYYSNTTYFRLFIADMFPEYDKVIYIDGDTVVQGDISELYNTDLGDKWIGACHEQAMVQTDHYGTYAEKVVGVSRHNFFNCRPSGGIPVRRHPGRGLPQPDLQGSYPVARPAMEHRSVLLLPLSDRRSKNHPLYHGQQAVALSRLHRRRDLQALCLRDRGA